MVGHHAPLLQMHLMNNIPLLLQFGQHARNMQDDLL